MRIEWRKALDQTHNKIIFCLLPHLRMKTDSHFKLFACSLSKPMSTVWHPVLVRSVNFMRIFGCDNRLQAPVSSDCCKVITQPGVCLSARYTTPASTISVSNKWRKLRNLENTEGITISKRKELGSVWYDRPFLGSELFQECCANYLYSSMCLVMHRLLYWTNYGVVAFESIISRAALDLVI